MMAGGSASSRADPASSGRPRYRLAASLATVTVPSGATVSTPSASDPIIARSRSRSLVIAPTSDWSRSAMPLMLRRSTWSSSGATPTSGARDDRSPPARVGGGRREPAHAAPQDARQGDPGQGGEAQHHDHRDDDPAPDHGELRRHAAQGLDGDDPAVLLAAADPQRRPGADGVAAPQHDRLRRVAAQVPSQVLGLGRCGHADDLALEEVGRQRVLDRHLAADQARDRRSRRSGRRRGRRRTGGPGRRSPGAGASSSRASLLARSACTLDSSVGSTTSRIARLAARPTASSAATSHPCRPRARRALTPPAPPRRRRRNRRRARCGSAPARTARPRPSGAGGARGR